MGYDKVIDSVKLDAGMKATADAIREKTGGTGPIVWDSANGFKAAVEGIQSGGGDCTSAIDALLDGSVTEINSDASSIRQYGCYGMKGLEKAVFTNLQQFNGTHTFANCVACKTYDFHKHIQYAINGTVYGIRLKTFDFNPRLTAVIFRGESVIKLENINAFNSCYHIHGTTNSNYNPNGLKDGYFYVPAALVNSYKAETNWSAFADNFRALEDYTVDGTITGELDQNKV